MASFPFSIVTYEQKGAHVTWTDPSKSFLFPREPFPIRAWRHGRVNNGTQYAEWVLNEIAKATNETFIGLKCMLHGFRIYLV